MNRLRIELSEDRSSFAPREELTGVVGWSLDKPATAVELRLFWFTRGKGTEDAAVARTVRFDRPLPDETRSFSLVLPEAPYSFSGKLISLIWALELVVEPSKEVVRREILIAPERREIRLGNVPRTR